METQKATVERIIEVCREPHQDSLSADPGRRHRQYNEHGVPEIKPYLLELLEKSQGTANEQAYGMERAVSLFRQFMIPVLERLKEYFSSEHSPREASLRHSDSQREINALKWSNEQLSRDINEERKIIIAKDEEIKQSKTDVRRLTTDNRRLSDELKQLKTDVRRLTNDNHRLQSEIHELESRACQRKSVSVQLFCTRRDDLVERVLNELTRMLQTTLELQRTDVTAVTADGVHDIRNDLPLLVICIQASRLGTDVENGLKGLQSYISWKNVACIVLHHKELHALPSQSSDSLLFSPNYKQLGAMIDMAFVRDKGMYPCEMNNRALDRLVHFITTHPVNQG